MDHSYKQIKGIQKLVRLALLVEQWTGNPDAGVGDQI